MVDGLSFLDNVLTVQDICQMWGKSRVQVTNAILRGYIDSRKSGRVYLISRSSVVRHWGSPIKELE